MYKNPNYPIFNFQSAIIVCLVVPPVHGPAINGLVLVGMVKTIAIKIGQVMIVVPRFQEKSEIIASFRVTVALAIKKVANDFLPYYVKIIYCDFDPYVIIFLIFILHLGTCDDGLENQDETGIDCGGSCSNPCSGTAYIQYL